MISWQLLFLLHLSDSRHFLTLMTSTQCHLLRWRWPRRPAARRQTPCQTCWRTRQCTRVGLRLSPFPPACRTSNLDHIFGWSRNPRTEAVARNCNPLKRHRGDGEKSTNRRLEIDSWSMSIISFSLASWLGVDYAAFVTIKSMIQYYRIETIRVCQNTKCDYIVLYDIMWL